MVVGFGSGHWSHKPATACYSSAIEYLKIGWDMWDIVVSGMIKPHSYAGLLEHAGQHAGKSEAVQCNL